MAIDIGHHPVGNRGIRLVSSRPVQAVLTNFRASESIMASGTRNGFFAIVNSTSSLPGSLRYDPERLPIGVEAAKVPSSGVPWHEPYLPILATALSNRACLRSDSFGYG